MESRTLPIASVDQPTVNFTRSLSRDLTWLPDHVRQMMGKLLNAYRYANDVGDSIWEFAIELDAAVLTLTDLRWLIRAGFVECAVEITQPNEANRSFEPLIGTSVSDSACLVLTRKGVELATALERRKLFAYKPQREFDIQRVSKTECAEDNNQIESYASLPKWDHYRQELHVGPLVVKRFLIPAPAQEVILAEFERKHWQARIDNPLPPVPDREPEVQLRETIDALNSNQKRRLIRFGVEDGGWGIVWEYISDDRSENGDSLRGASD